MAEGYHRGMQPAIRRIELVEYVDEQHNVACGYGYWMLLDEDGRVRASRRDRYVSPQLAVMWARSVIERGDG